MNYMGARSDIGTCRGCGAKIKWMKTRAGKSMPVDYGKVFIYEDGVGTETIITEEGDVFKGTRVRSRDYNTKEGWTPHFATCPDRDKFKKDKRK